MANLVWPSTVHGEGAVDAKVVTVQYRPEAGVEVLATPLGVSLVNYGVLGVFFITRPM